MPQLDTSTYFSQIFWLVICVSAIFFSLKHIFLPRVETIIKKRQEEVDNFHNKSKALKDETLEIKLLYDKKIQEAYLSSNNLAKKKMLEFEEYSEKRIQELNDAQRIETEEYKKQLLSIKASFLSEVDNEVDDLTKKFKKKIETILN